MERGVGLARPSGGGGSRAAADNSFCCGSGSRKCAAALILIDVTVLEKRGGGGERALKVLKYSNESSLMASKREGGEEARHCSDGLLGGSRSAARSMGGVGNGQSGTSSVASPDSTAMVHRSRNWLGEREGDELLRLSSRHSDSGPSTGSTGKAARPMLSSSAIGARTSGCNDVQT